MNEGLLTVTPMSDPDLNQTIMQSSYETQAQLQSSDVKF